MPDQPGKLVFRKRHRLSHIEEFNAVFAHKIRKSQGPITVHIKPNLLDQHRLGLSIGRRVGGAVARGRLKRMIREVFRHNQHRIATPEHGHYDLIVSARKHKALSLGEYQSAILNALDLAHKVHEGRARKGADDG